MPKVVPAKRPSSRSARAPRGRRPINPGVFLGIVAGAVLLIVAGIIALQNGAVGRTPQVQGQVGEGMTWGPTDAPVKIIEYSNFGCSHCRNFALQDGLQLRSTYEPTGKVRFEFKPMSLGSAGPDLAASAALCAADQSRFWDYHDVLFSKSGTSADPFSAPQLKQYAAQLGLDQSQFGSCVDQGKYRGQVQQYAAEGSAQGINATPTFFVNGQRTVGEISYADLKTKIDTLLASAR